MVVGSAQFSASIAELSDRFLVGTMLTVQTAGGFLLTLATIHLTPHAVDALDGAGLSPSSPLDPPTAMAPLRAHPEAGKLAGGRR